MAELIDQFIARYAKEYDFYSQVGRLAAQILEADLQEAGIRAIVTSRAKAISRLTDKCQQRDAKRGGYSSVDEIFQDIVDLAGVRVALYFPAEANQVDLIITRLFYQIRPKRSFPDPEEPRPGKRFGGYSANHYLVKLREQNLSDPQRRYAAAQMEIQVASVLMHAWAEVEHDLDYKPLNGNLSDDEKVILDELNGLVLVGELSLERLQKAGEARVAITGRKFANHYDLAAYLLGQAVNLTNEPISDAELGRVDLLFDLIRELNKDSPEAVSPYLVALDGNLELRPLSEQIIEALLAEDPARYGLYSLIRARRQPSFPWAEINDSGIFQLVGQFIAAWSELEQLIRELAPRATPEKPIVFNIRQLRNSNLLDSDMAADIDRLRRVRNNLVHGIEIPDAAYLTEAIEYLKTIIDEIRRRAGGGHEEDHSN